MFRVFFMLLVSCSLVVATNAAAALKVDPYFRSDYKYESSLVAFYKVHKSLKYWTDARATCQYEGASLVVPETQAEINVLIQLIQQQLRNDTTGIFVGIHDMFIEGTFMTVNGEEIEDIFVNWADGEPNDVNDNEDCVLLHRNSKYYDYNCKAKFPFICKKSLATLTANPLCETADKATASNPFFRSDYTYEPSYKSFYKTHSYSASWFDALAICETEGAHLATPGSKAEREFLVRFVEGNITITYDAFALHIGIHDIFAEGWYTTLDGQIIPPSREYWDKGEPDNANNEDCVIMRRTGKYKDVDCTSKFWFVCKKTLDTLAVNTGCATSDLAYFPNDDTGSCYKLHLIQKTWSDAFATCQAEQSYLAIINSADEAQFFKEKFADHPPTSLLGDIFNDGIYLGFHDMFFEGNYITIHGTPLSQTGFTQWQPGQPDNAGGQEDCGHMTRSGLLNDINCSSKRIFFCERDLEETERSIISLRSSA